MKVENINNDDPIRDDISAKQLSDAIVSLYAQEPFDPAYELFDYLSYYSSRFSVERSGLPDKDYKIEYGYKNKKYCILIKIDIEPGVHVLAKKSRIRSYAEMVIKEITEMMFKEFLVHWQEASLLLEGYRQFTKEDFKKLLWKDGTYRTF